MDQITATEDAIITRLKDLLQTPGLSAAALPYPDRDFETYEPLHNNGEILVAYTGEDDGPTRSTAMIVQERQLTFELTFVFSSLRSLGNTGGLYAHLEAVRLGLTGFKPEMCPKKAFPVSVERVRRYKKRWWQYVQAWEFSGINIEVPEEEQAPLLQRITLLDIKTNDSTEVP